MGCSASVAVKAEPARTPSGSVRNRKSNETLASETHFSVDEVYALEELFNNLSNALHRDGLIHKDEFAFALFKAEGKGSLFVDKVFQTFDSKRTDTIDFEEFVQALSVFHPRAGLEEKAKFAFLIYDLDNTGYIEPDEIKRFLAELLRDNPHIILDTSEINEIVNQTLREADLAGDGHISMEEWLSLVRSNPGIISYMTLPVLRQVTTKYPSFLFNKSRP